MQTATLRGGPGTSASPITAASGAAVVRGERASSLHAGDAAPAALPLQAAMAAASTQAGADASGDRDSGNGDEAIAALASVTAASNASSAGIEASLQTPASTMADAPAPMLRAELAARPHAAAFAGELGAQLRVMVSGGIESAELRLNPAELGPIRIHLKVHEQQAEIRFEAAHGATREGIERSLPQLREMLAGEGLALAQAQVGGGQAQGGQGDPAHGEAAGWNGPGHAHGTSAAGASAAAAMPAARAARGLLDLYA